MAAITLAAIDVVLLTTPTGHTRDQGVAYHRLTFWMLPMISRRLQILSAYSAAYNAVESIGFAAPVITSHQPAVKKLR